MVSSEKELAYWREYRKRPEVRERARLRSKHMEKDPAYRKYKNEWNRKHPHKYIWDKIKKRIEYGTLKRQPCVFCGASKVYAHHPDYNKPLEIVWVCNEHHRLIHAGALKVLRKQIQVVPVRGKRLP